MAGIQQQRNIPIETWARKMLNRPKIGDMLVKRGLISEETRRSAVERQKIISEQGGQELRIGEILIEMQAITEHALLTATAEEFGFNNLIGLDKRRINQLFPIDMELIQEFQSNFLRRVEIVPINYTRSSDENSRVMVVNIAMSDPSNLGCLEEVKRRVSAFVKKKQLSNDFDRCFIECHVMTKRDVQSLLNEISGNMGRSSLGPVTVESEQSAQKQFFYGIIESALQARASDIHLENLSDHGGVSTRFRIDGELETIDDFTNPFDGNPAEMWESLVRVFFSQSAIPSDGMPKRQDGSFRHPYRGVQINFRVAWSPRYSDNPKCPAGHFTIRVLESKGFSDIKHIGLCREDLDAVRRMSSRPNGIFIVSGKTSSGKSSTLYALLGGKDVKRQSVFTLEDPVERRMEGVTQIEINEAAGLTWEEGLKFLARSDPQIVLLGEIRDAFSAKSATMLAQTGSLIYSTLHTDSVYTIPKRLMQLGVDPNNIAYNLVGAIGQNLVKKNCTECLEEYRPNQSALRVLELDAGGTYFRGSGRAKNGGVCSKCGGRGTYGRTGIFEIMPLSLYDDWQDLISREDSPRALRSFCAQHGHGDIMADASRKMEEGIISPDSLVTTIHKADWEVLS